MNTHKHMTRLLVAGTALWGLLYGVAAQATDVSARPLQHDSLIKPNIIFGMDDSGSMDWEILMNTTQGVLWWNSTNPSGWSGATPLFGVNTPTATNVAMGYLFPIGAGAAAGRNHYDYSSVWGQVVPPTAQYAPLRSSAFNPLYYNSTVTYAPWAPAYHDGASKTYGPASTLAAKTHPAVAATATVNLAIDQGSLASPPNPNTSFAYQFRAGMRIPVGARKWNGSAWLVPETSETVSTGTTWVAMAQYFPTFWHPSTSCTAVANSATATCVTAPDGTKLQRYEIKPTTLTFPSNRSYVDELQNFANWFTYYRKRKLMLASAMGTVLEDIAGLRLGVVSYNNGATAPPNNVVMSDADNALDSDNRRRIAGVFYTNAAANGTPTSETLKFIGEQYKRTGSAVVQYACQRNNAFIVTDGMTSSGSVSPPSYSSATYGAGFPYQTTQSGTVADIALSYFTNNLRPDLTAGKVTLGDQTKRNPDPNPNLHMNTYGMTLGVRGNIWPGITDPWAGSPFTWPSPVAGTPSSIDDLWHATINGRGQMYLASSPEETRQKIQAGLTAMLDQAGAQSSSAVSTVNLSKGDGKAYLSHYNPKGWSGNVTANSIDTNTGAVATATNIWSAAGLLTARDPATRVIVTNNGTSKGSFTTSLVATLLNPLNEFAANTNELVAYLRGDRSQEGSKFRSRTSLLGAVINARPTLAAEATAANSVVYAQSGEGMLHALDASNGNELWAYVPKTVLPRLGKTSDPAYNFDTLLDGTPTVAYAGSRRILVGGSGVAGAGYYAIDVTSPRSLTESSLAGNVLWDIGNGDASAGQTFTLGKSVGRPVVAPTRLASNPNVVLLTQGYNGSNDGIGRLYMVNAISGAIITTFTADSGTGSGDPGLAHVTALLESDGKVRYAYGGDERGNLWRFDLEAGTSTAAGTRIAQLRDAGGAVQPVTTAPALVTIRGERVVLVGTGRILGLSDFGATGTQTFYAIKDEGAVLGNARASLVARNLVADDLGVATRKDLSGSAFTWTGTRGWYIDLPAGQQVNHLPTVALGSVVFSANMATLADCSASSYLYVVDIGTGLNVSGMSYAGTTISGTQMIAGMNVLRLGPSGQPKFGVEYRLQDGRSKRDDLNIAPAITPRKNAWRQIRRN